MSWTGNIVVNGDANNGTSSWDAVNVTVGTIGKKNYFHLQNGRMKQSINVEKWIIGVHQVRLSFVARVNESVTDNQVQSVARIKLHFEDGRVETTYRLIEVTDFKAFEATHDINKRKVTKIDIEIQGADLLITDITCEKSFGVDDDTADYIKSQMPVYLYATNNASLSIGAIQQYPLSVVVEHEESTNLNVGLLVIGQANTTMTVTIKFLLAGERINPEINQICSSGWNTINVNFLVPQVQPGSRRFEVQIQTSAGTMSIPIEHMRLFVMGANLQGGLGSDAPLVNWEEKFAISKVMPRASDVLPDLQTPVPSEMSQSMPRQKILTSVKIQLG